METAFLIISYTKNNFGNINTCVNSIRSFYPNTKIIIVDNFINGEPNVDFGENIYYYKNDTNSYEMGAIWYGVKKHVEVDRWITIHDSCKLNSEIPFDINQTSNNSLFIPFWCEVPESYSPTMPILIDYLNKTKVSYDEIKNNYWKSVCGLMFISDSNILKKIIELDFDNILPNKKIEAVCSESLLGLIVTHVINKEMTPLLDGPISMYISKQKPWTFIEKYAHGLGIASVDTNRISQESKLHPKNLINSNVFNSLDECVKFISNKIVSDTDMLNEIINTGVNELSFDSGYNSNVDIILAYKIARHQSFTFKYFGDSYYKLYN